MRTSRPCVGSAAALVDVLRSARDAICGQSDTGTSVARRTDGEMRRAKAVLPVLEHRRDHVGVVAQAVHVVGEALELIRERGRLSTHDVERGLLELLLPQPRLARGELAHRVDASAAPTRAREPKRIRVRWVFALSPPAEAVEPGLRRSTCAQCGASETGRATAGWAPSTRLGLAPAEGSSVHRSGHRQHGGGCVPLRTAQRSRLMCRVVCTAIAAV